MRTEQNKDGFWNFWLSRSEYETLPRMASTFEREIAIRLMGDCGLRVQEVLDIQPVHISRMTDSRHFALEVVGGKDTTGESQHGKHRETWLPRDVEAIINRYIQQHDITDHDPLVNASKRTVQYWVEDAATAAADETGDDHYRRVSTHDLRRCWANHLLVEESVSPRIVMALGGWSSYNAIEPYLAAPTEDNIITSMSRVDCDGILEVVSCLRPVTGRAVSECGARRERPCYPYPEKRGSFTAVGGDTVGTVVVGVATEFVGELLRDPDDLRRRGIRWEGALLTDGSMEIYRKKQQWDVASLPDPVLSPLRNCRKLLDLPSDR